MNTIRYVATAAEANQIQAYWTRHGLSVSVGFTGKLYKVTVFSS